jgi:hypothetical protein
LSSKRRNRWSWKSWIFKKKSALEEESPVREDAHRLRTLRSRRFSGRELLMPASRCMRLIRPTRQLSAGTSLAAVTGCPRIMPRRSSSAGDHRVLESRCRASFMAPCRYLHGIAGGMCGASGQRYLGKTKQCLQHTDGRELPDPRRRLCLSGISHGL